MLDQKFWGAVLLIAGCCIGAGMLGLPLVTLSAGFVPSVFSFVLCWLFMYSTGLLLLEVNLWYGKGTHLMGLAEMTLGKAGKIIVGALFLFLFYCLMVAYLAGGGAIISEGLHLAGIEGFPPNVGGLFLALAFGMAIYFGLGVVDSLNRWLMLGLAVAYAGLLVQGLPHIKTEQLAHANWEGIKYSFPALVISFGFHNLVPNLTDYLERDVKKLRGALFIGSILPLLVYLFWDGVILGLVPASDYLVKEAASGAMVTQLIEEVNPGKVVTLWTEGFAFFALVTSFLAVALSFVGFLSEKNQWFKKDPHAIVPTLLVLGVPLVFAAFRPTIFLTALNYAGAYGAVLLFGVIPVIMVWKGRYVDKKKGPILLPGGKITLSLAGAFAFAVFLIQFFIDWRQ
jgi:tyrosine-specific transport protein